MTLDEDIPLLMNYNDFGDLAFHLVPLSRQSLSFSNTLVYEQISKLIKAIILH